MATANPHFEVQQQAIDSLKRIHQICLALEALQIVASLLVLSLGYFTARKFVTIGFHLYAAMMYFFIALFAHAVVFYVLLAIGKNVRSVYVSNPNSVDEWLVLKTGKHQNDILPVILAHSLVLLVMVVMALTTGSVHDKPVFHHVAAWLATVVGAACFARIYSTLKVNGRYLTSFVTSGGFTYSENPDV